MIVQTRDEVGCGSMERRGANGDIFIRQAHWVGAEERRGIFPPKLMASLTDKMNNVLFPSSNTMWRDTCFQWNPHPQESNCCLCVDR